jgi:dipeptidyl aminopeptidase/acylaminoacyl peptidase
VRRFQRSAGASADPHRPESGVGRIAALLSAAALLIVALITIDLYGLVGAGDTVLHLVDLGKGKLQPALPLRENPPLGHSDPSYSPDGTKIAFVMEGRNGAEGAPQIWIYDLGTGKERFVANDVRGPSWSPDGRYLAATRVEGTTLDVVVLDAATGVQVGRVTYDGFSWAPVWSPEGDELVYLHLSSTVVEMFMTEVNRSGAGFDLQAGLGMTDYGGLDGDSRPAWYVPGSGSAAATASPTATALPHASVS